MRMAGLCNKLFKKVYLSLMDTKIISLPTNKKKSELSRLMIVTLIEALAKQNHGIPYGPVDIRGGSFGALIKRELVIYREVKIKNRTQSLWQITPKGINILRSIGVEVAECRL
jgi:hypothetical protein